MSNYTLNITMPVFNRLQTTLRTLLALRNQSRRNKSPQISFCITVVDNGSEAELRSHLVEFKKQGIIDNLFLLPNNYGISCAANIGWKMVDAPYYMKLDNDMLCMRPDWADTLFSQWKYGEPYSTLGGAPTMETLTREPGTIETPLGPLGICPTNLCGQAIIIPKTVSDMLGYWSEDYDLYGAEDGDYGLRMRAIGFPQYYYLRPDFFEDLGMSDIYEVYSTRNIDRKTMCEHLYHDERGLPGLYRINAYLYSMCLRNWNVPLRYEVVAVSEDYHVTLKEREEYEPVRNALARCKEKIDNLVLTQTDHRLSHPDFVEEIKEIWVHCGEHCEKIIDHTSAQLAQTGLNAPEPSAL